jgi:hypothetical protein
LTDLDVAADLNLAYSHSNQRVAGTDKQGKKLDLMVRVTTSTRKRAADGSSFTSKSRCRSISIPANPISPPNHNSAADLAAVEISSVPP